MGPPKILMLEQRVEVEPLATSIFSLKFSCPGTMFQIILVTAGVLHIQCVQKFNQEQFLNFN